MEPGTRPLQCFAAVCIFIETVTFGVPPPLHLQAQFPMHEPLVDANGSKTQSQRSRPVTFAPPTEGASSCSRPPLLATRRQLQAVSVTKEPVPGASGAEPAMVTAASERAAAVDTLGARLKPNVVPAKLFQCSRLSGRNKKSSKFICPQPHGGKICCLLALGVPAGMLIFVARHVAT